MDTETRQYVATVIEGTIALVAKELEIAPADAGRALLVALARWFGINFEREAERAEAALEQ